MLQSKAQGMKDGVVKLASRTTKAICGLHDQSTKDVPHPIRLHFDAPRNSSGHGLIYNRF